MGWTRAKLRMVAFSILVAMSVIEARIRTHGTLYSNTPVDVLLEESRRVARMPHSAPHPDHIDLDEYAEFTEAPASFTEPPVSEGLNATKPLLTMLVPIYNEGTSVPALLERIEALNARYQLEAVTVDDGSVDDTALRLAEAPSGLLHLLRNEAHSGYLSALRAGVQATTSKVIVILDAHAQVDVFVMARLLDALGTPQTVAVALPNLRGMNDSRSLFLRVTGFITRVLVFLCTGRWVSNLAPPICAFRREFLDRVLVQAPRQGLHPYAYAALLPGPHRIYDVDVA